MAFLVGHMLNHPKSLIKRILYKVGVYRLNGISNRFYILPYHMVVSKVNGFFPETSTLSFEKQVAHLAKNYKVLSLDEIVTRARNRISLRRCAAITFDDGFGDNYENAYPVLKKYNVPATVFLATRCIETGAAPWFIRLRYIFMKTDRTEYELPLKGQNGFCHMRTSTERFAASETVMTHLKTCLEQERISLMDRLCRELGICDFTGLNDLMLNWDQIREMSKYGISFGAHTVTHPVLSTISMNEAEREVSESKTVIEGKIGQPVTTFAYPFGKRRDYKREMVATLEKLQFNCAVTTETGINNYNTPPFELNRFSPWELSPMG